MQLASLDVKSGSEKGPLSLLHGVIEPLRLMTISSEMGNMEIFEHLERIDRYLQDEDAVSKLLYFLPSQRSGLCVIAEAMFSSNTEISQLAGRILKKIKMTSVGESALEQSLNMFHLLRLNDVIN